MRRRSPTKNPTCAKNGVHLRQEPGMPAPEIGETCVVVGAGALLRQGNYPRKPRRESSTKGREEGRTMRMSA